MSKNARPPTGKSRVGGGALLASLQGRVPDEDWRVAADLDSTAVLVERGADATPAGAVAEDGHRLLGVHRAQLLSLIDVHVRVAMLLAEPDVDDGDHRGGEHHECDTHDLGGPLGSHHSRLHLRPFCWWLFGHQHDYQKSFKFLIAMLVFSTYFKQRSFEVDFGLFSQTFYHFLNHLYFLLKMIVQSDILTLPKKRI